ncbi:MAG: hypothetical protein JO281_09750 [Pseudonocardiales bacterium]|nr:hypothetical protein [Pseudonocardiales bacterium]MBV9161815.1 hypothetical protein [Pseudonocardiales bacterium]
MNKLDQGDVLLVGVDGEYPVLLVGSSVLGPPGVGGADLVPEPAGARWRTLNSSSLQSRGDVEVAGRAAAR